MQREYVRKLAQSKIVVTHNPNFYEGDSRTFEALASGALVLLGRLVDPPPSLVSGVNVVFYDNYRDLIGKVLYYLQHPDEADAIAQKGREAVWSPSQLIDHVLDIVVGRGCKAKVFLHIAQMELTRELKTVVGGFKSNERVQLVDKAEDCDFVVLDLMRMTWKSLMSPQLREALENLHDKLGKNIVVFDWGDETFPWYWDARVKYYFKRSRVDKSINKFHIIYPYGFNMSLLPPLYYPLKPEWAQAMAEELKGGSPRAQRPVDVSCLFSF